MLPDTLDTFKVLFSFLPTQTTFPKLIFPISFPLCSSSVPSPQKKYLCSNHQNP